MIPTQKCPHCGIDQIPDVRSGVAICSACLRPLETTYAPDAPNGLPEVPKGMPPVPKGMPSIPAVPNPPPSATPVTPPPVPPTPKPKPRTNPELDFELEMREPIERDNDDDGEDERDSSTRRGSRRPQRKIERPERALQQRGLPFELNPDEQVLMRAGFGTLYARLWIGLTIPFSFFCIGPLSILQAIISVQKEDYLFVPIWILLFLGVVLFCLWPLLLSGRYWLTTERIFWKPRLGKPREMWVRDVDKISSGGMKSSIKIYDAEGNKITPRFVADLPRLWGGIVALSAMKPRDFAAGRRSTVDVSYFRGWRIDGMNNQRGLVVLRPEYVAFLPMRKNIHVGYEFIKQTVGKALKDTLGMKEEFPVEAEMPFDVIVGMMSEQSPNRFDRFIEFAMEEFAGTLIYWDEAKLWRESIPFSGGRCRIGFESEREKLYGVPGRDQDAYVNAVTREWNNRKPIPVFYPILRPLIVTLIVAGLMTALITRVSQSEGPPAVEMGFVNSAQIMDRVQTPEKVFVTWMGTPEPTKFTPLTKDKKEVERRAFVSCREEPNLILYIKDRDDMYQHLSAQASTTRPKKNPPPNPSPTDRAYTITGQIFNGGSDAWSNNKNHRQALRDFTSEQLGTTDVYKVRVMVVGKTPKTEANAPYVAYVFAGILGILGLMGFVVTIRAMTLAIIKPKND